MGELKALISCTVTVLQCSRSSALLSHIQEQVSHDAHHILRICNSVYVNGHDMYLFQHNLQSYIEQILHSITSSGLMCPTSICEVFFALRELVENHFPGIGSLLRQ